MKNNILWIVFGILLLVPGLLFFVVENALGGAVLALIGALILIIRIAKHIGVGTLAAIFMPAGLVLLILHCFSNDNNSIWAYIGSACFGFGFINFSIYAFIESYKCPSCKRKWARKQINRIVLNQGPVFYKPDNNGKEHPYTNQVVEYHYKCKYCGEEWTKTKEEKKQLDS